MIFGYARVSTADQNHQLQLDALQAAGVDEVITDTISGGKKERPGLDRLLDKAREGDVIVVWRLDRLARSLSNLLQLVETLQARGIALKSLHEEINTASANGRLMLHLFGALGEFEKSLILERSAAGLASAKAEGRVGGRPPALSPEQQAMIRSLHRSGEIPAKALWEQFGISRPTFYRIVGGNSPAAQVSDKEELAGLLRKAIDNWTPHAPRNWLGKYGSLKTNGETPEAKEYARLRLLATFPAQTEDKE